MRNLRSEREFRHPRGAGAQFTIDGKFAVFTLAQSRRTRKGVAPTAAEAPRVAKVAKPLRQAQGRQPRRRRRSRRRPRAAADKGGNQRQEPHAGWASCRCRRQGNDGRKVQASACPKNPPRGSRAHKGTGGAGGGAPAGGGRGGRGGSGAAPAGGRGGAGGGQAGAANARDRKQPGSDLILGNLTTGEETTIPEVSEYLWNTKGDWLAYAASSNDAAKDGAFARRMSDGTVTTLHSGKGRYRSLVFDEAGTQIAFLSDTAEFDKPVARTPVLLEGPFDRLRAGWRRKVHRDRFSDNRWHAERPGRGRERRPAVLARRLAALRVDRSPAATASQPERRHPGSDRGGPVVDEGRLAGPCSGSAPSRSAIAITGRSTTSPTEVRAARDPGTADGEPRR